MPLRDAVTLDRVRADFDEIATLADAGASGIDRYDTFLLSLIPGTALRVLDVGCGMGRLTAAIARPDREVVGVDLSPAMIERARGVAVDGPVTFDPGDFLNSDFDGRRFDCVVSAAALHHMPQETALARMADLLTPGGRLIVHDLRSDAGAGDTLRAGVAFAHESFERLVRTGRPRHSPVLRRAWERHGETETYLTLAEARALAARCLPGARVMNHWLWRYTIVWDRSD